MNPDLTKVPALKDLLILDKQTNLQSFLGLINYIQPFISGLANKTIFHYEQLAKWDWNPLTNVAFQCLKSGICSMLLKTTLAYYDSTQPVIVQTNGSTYGLGAALVQNVWSITFASKTLTDIKMY